MRRRITILVAIALAVVFGACLLIKNPEPEKCRLCNYIPSHAPCLVNLQTGEIGEIALYQPHRTKVGEIAEEQRGGYFSFMSVAGLRGYMDACIPEAHIDVPQEAGKYEERFFCECCRGLLSEHIHTGFALADLKDPSNPTVYAVEEGTVFTVRCYSVSVAVNDEGELSITVTGSIPTDG